MNDILLNLLVFAGVLIIAGAIFVFSRGKKKKENKALTDFARKNSWQIEHIRKSLEYGFKLRAPQWTLTALSRSSGVESGPGSSDWEQRTSWSNNQGGTTILVGPRLSPIDTKTLPPKIMDKIFQSGLGTDGAGLTEVAVGSAAFQEKFMVWAQDPDRVEDFLSPNLQYMLMKWTKTPPLIKQTSNGTTIELKGVHLKNIEDVKALINLGEQLL